MDKTVLVLKAFSDRNRLRIIAALTDYPFLCACQLTELLAVSGATVSRHLGILAGSGIIESRKDGRWVFFSLNHKSPELGVVFGWVRNQIKDSDDYKCDVESLKKITAIEPEVLCRKQRGEKCCP